MTIDATSEDKPEAGKMLGLEVIRFLCAMAVLVWHYQHFYKAAGSPEFVRSEQPFYGALSLFYEYGLYGVQIFWAISGFIFFWKYGEAIARGVVSGSRFFWLRFSRLYPLHFATLLIVAALQPLHGALTGGPLVYEHNNLGNFALQLIMATHWFGPLPFTFNGPIWSVSAEIFVYAAFFLLVRRFGSSGWLIAAAILVSMATLAFGIETPSLTCMGFFFAGGAAAKAMLNASAKGEIEGPCVVAAIMLAAVVGSCWWTGTLGNRSLLPVMLLLTVPPMLFLAAQDWRWLDRWQAPIQAAGNLTYSSYLCHFPLQLIAAIAAAAGGFALPVASLLFLAGYLAVSLVVARVVYVHFERPAQDWIRSLALKRKAALA
jgi:peptidoglycan/LPS O-acetylase OafA/YrhL